MITNTINDKNANNLVAFDNMYCPIENNYSTYRTDTGQQFGIVKGNYEVEGYKRGGEVKEFKMSPEELKKYLKEND